MKKCLCFKTYETIGSIQKKNIENIFLWNNNFIIMYSSFKNVRASSCFSIVAVPSSLSISYFFMEK